MKKVYLFVILLFFFLGCSKEKPIPNNSESTKVFQFDDSEIRYYEKVYYKSYGNPKNEKDFAELKIEYPELISNQEVSDSVNKFILNYLLNLPFNEDTYSDFDEIADSLMSNYISVQQEFNDYHTSWYIHASSKITGVFNNTISIRSEEEIYTGGANTFYNLTFANFNLKTGKYLTLDDIFNESNITIVENIGKDIFNKMKDIPKDQSLEQAGYWFENNVFSLNDNFSITDSGLVFFYNLYAIAPRSEGTTKLFIPKEKLISLTNFY